MKVQSPWDLWRRFQILKAPFMEDRTPETTMDIARGFDNPKLPSPRNVDPSNATYGKYSHPEAPLTLQWARRISYPPSPPSTMANLVRYNCCFVPPRLKASGELRNGFVLGKMKWSSRQAVSASADARVAPSLFRNCRGPLDMRVFPVLRP